MNNFVQPDKTNYKLINFLKRLLGIKVDKELEEEKQKLLNKTVKY
ncbi:MAG: hypothetical protein [Bacteriophage sp.]|nr:MAG: hypothetical protein [Bacteriophage sp.]